MESRKIRIHLLHKLPTPYNDFLFQKLHEHPDVLLQVHHLWRHRSNRPWTVDLATGYPNRYMDTRYLGIDWRLLKLALQEKTGFFIIGDWAHLAAIAILLIRILIRAPVAIWADTPQEHIYRPWYKRIPRRWFLNWLLPRVDIVFGTGKPGVSTLIQMGVPADRAVNLPCYVDLDIPQKTQKSHDFPSNVIDLRRRTGGNEPKVVFLISGTCAFYKGVDIAIKAFSICLRDAKVPVGLMIAGAGPELSNLERLAVTLGIRDRAAFLGWLNPDEMNYAYAACDVLVHPARRDSFPLVVLEAMSWGKVVIGSDVCGSVQDRVVDGVNGFVFPSEDVEFLANIMIQVAEDDALRQRIGLEARRTAEAWPVEKGVETIIQTARTVLSRYQ